MQGTATGFPLGVAIGVIFGALIGNMAIGILLGLALGFGIVKLPGKRSGSQMANPIGVLTSRVILAIGAISLAASFPGGRSMYKPWPGRARMGSMDG